MEELVLIGFGGHAKSVIDSILLEGKYHIYGALDESKIGEKYRGCEVIGNDDMLLELFQKGVNNAFVTIGYMGNSTLRKKIYKVLSDIGYQLPCIIDPSAEVAKDAIIGEGSFVGKNTVINAQAVVGKMNIINTGAIIEHECKIGDYSHIAIGAKLSGNVKVNEAAFIGAGSVIIQGIDIGKEAIVGAGAVVIRDVLESSTVVGNPAKQIK